MPPRPSQCRLNVYEAGLKVALRQHLLWPGQLVNVRLLLDFATQ
jgi:hypothetical protein